VENGGRRMSRTVLIDADILCYTTAYINEEPTEFANGLFVLWADAAKTKADLVDNIDHILEKVDADDFLLCLTDKENFRKDILPSYKSNRSGSRKPMMLPFLREFIIENLPHDVRKGLEGDDLMGIYATHPDLDGEYVIYSADKDMKTIPALLWDEEDGQIRKVSEEEANRNWLFQTLTGDTTDGYTGCPKVGPVSANKILDKECSFEAVVVAFEKAGLSKFEATQQAQVARILRFENYDLVTDTLKVWRPE
jgi:DNA polymerase-1